MNASANNAATNSSAAATEMTILAATLEVDFLTYRKPSAAPRRPNQKTIMSISVIGYGGSKHMSRTARRMLAACACLALLMPARGGAARVRPLRTSSMIPNTDAQTGLRSLVDLLRASGIKTPLLDGTLLVNEVHQEGPEAGGFLLASGTVDGAFGVMFPACGDPRDRIPCAERYGSVLRGTFLLVLLDDPNTHIVLEAEAISDLRTRGDRLYSTNMPVVVHELFHAMNFRTRCFTGTVAAEEALAPIISFDLTDRLAAYRKLLGCDLAGAEADLNFLRRLVGPELIQHPEWRECYDSLGVTNDLPSANCGPTHFDAVTDFSLTNGNPNGAWTYGSMPPGGGSLSPYGVPTPNSCGVQHLDQWEDSSSCLFPPFVIGNSAGVDLGPPFGISFPPDVLLVHPAFGADTVVRWTAPLAGNYAVSGSFVGLDQTGTTTDVDVRLNGASLPSFPGMVRGYQASVPIGFTRTFAKDDHLDFVVNIDGLGASGDAQAHDSTGLAVQITKQ